MSKASFLDRSPEVSLPSAFAICIRWWLKRKLKRNPLSFSAALPRLPCDQLPLFVLLAERVARTVPWPGNGFLVRPSLSPRPVGHLSNANVN